MKSYGSAELHVLLNYINDIKLWLSQNFLYLNRDKTEHIVFGSCTSDVNALSFGTLASYVKPVVKNLGVTSDSSLKFDQQINSVVETGFFRLRLLDKVKSFLGRRDLEKAVHAFISSRLDCCNALYVSLNQSSMSRLQLVQNAAARFFF